MPGIKVSIERFTSDEQPGWVECRLIDCSGAHHMFVEKVPAVSAADLDAGTEYPRDGVIGCTVIASYVASDGREHVTVDTELPWHIASTSGRTRFDVLRDQVVGLA